MDLSDLNVLKPIQANELRNQSNNSNSNNNTIAPPLPVRPNLRQTYSHTNYGINSNYYSSPYSSSPLFNSYGSTYGNYGSYSNPYSNNHYQQQPFLRTAEESYRNAFQSIESVVYAFSSISAMFESTFHALYNSFRAVIGVADQFYRVKQQLTNILSTFALFRLLKYLYRKLLRILRFNFKEDKENLWNKININNGTEGIIKQLNQNNSNSWPLVLFFGIIIGGPWLIWKLLTNKQKDDTQWMQGKIDHFIAVSEYDFDAENTDELSFKRGMKVIIAPKEYQPKMRGWLLGSIDGQTCGIMPANYLKLLGKKIGTLNEASQQEQLENAFEHS